MNASIAVNGGSLRIFLSLARQCDCAAHCMLPARKRRSSAEGNCNCCTSRPFFSHLHKNCASANKVLPFRHPLLKLYGPVPWNRPLFFLFFQSPPIFSRPAP